MKKLTFAVILIATSLIGLGISQAHNHEPGHTDNQAADSKAQNMQTATISIEGMTCGSCEKNISKNLKALDGVTVKSIDHETGTAVVEMSKSSKLTDESFKEAIVKAGYTFKGIEKK